MDYVRHLAGGDCAGQAAVDDRVVRLLPVGAAIAKYAEQETLYDQPKVDRSKVRVTGPFTVEAVPAPAVRPISEIDADFEPVPGTRRVPSVPHTACAAYNAIARYGETLRQVKKGEHKDGTRSVPTTLYEVEIHGFDYYNPRSGAIESGDTTKIALWMLDTDYDGRSLFPRQVFFPMAGPKDGWARLAKNLKAEIDEDLIEAYRGTVSLPFAAGDYRRAAVKIVDDRGIESLKIVEIA